MLRERKRKIYRTKIYRLKNYSRQADKNNKRFGDNKSAREKCKEEQATDRAVFRNRTRFEADRAAHNVEARSLNMDIEKMKRDFNIILNICREIVR